MEPEADYESSFNEKEIRDILRRAVELEEARQGGRPVGLSLTELQQVAAEVGIDPRSVASAASELFHTVPAMSAWWGGPLLLSVEKVVDGSLDSETWEEMVFEIRDAFRDTGNVRVREQAREWTHSGKSGVHAHVTATSHDGQTRIRLFWHEPATPAGVYVPLSGLGIILLPIIFGALTMSALIGTPLYLSLLTLLFFVARRTVGRMAADGRQRVTDLAQRLEDVVARRLRAATAVTDNRDRLGAEGGTIASTVDEDETECNKEWHVSRTRSRV